MGTKDITDLQVCLAVQKYQQELQAMPRKVIYGMSPDYEKNLFPYEALAIETGQPEKVCYRAMERASNKGLLECGVSLRTSWLSEKGKALLNEINANRQEKQNDN
jgi:hypothetical protein